MLCHQVREMRDGETVRFWTGPPGVEHEQLLLDLMVQDLKETWGEEVVMVTVETHVRVMLALPPAGERAVG